jgi:hypothetical protein
MAGSWEGRGRVVARSRQGNGMVCVNRPLTRQGNGMVYVNRALLRVKGQRNILHEISKRKANFIGHILRRNCLLRQVIE